MNEGYKPEDPDFEPEDAYEAALARRIDELETRHTYSWAKDAKNRLEQMLQASSSAHITSIGIGLNADQSDLTLVIRVADPESAASIPSEFRGLIVDATVSGRGIAF